MSKKIDKDDLNKALEALADLAKGHNSRGTNTTKVEPMSGEGGATQVFHTASNSNPGSWAGTSETAVSENGASDSVSENGTDYEVAKLMKSIANKIAKGQKLSGAEKAILKAMAGEPDGDEDDKKVAKGANPFAKDKDKDDKKHAEPDGDEVSKSLADFASEDETVSKGLEVSEFLAGFAGVINKSLQVMEERMASRILGALVAEAESTGSFQKSLADAVVNLGEAISAQAQRIEQIESSPARAPKSVANVQALNKGSYAGEGESLTKSLVSNTLSDMVEKSMIPAIEVIKFESTGELTPDLEQRVRAHLGRR